METFNITLPNSWAELSNKQLLMVYGLFLPWLTGTLSPTSYANIGPGINTYADVAPSYSSEVVRLCLQCGSDNIRVWEGHA